MASDSDWTTGPAKWIAVGLLSAAAIMGMTWTIAQKYPSRAEGVVIQPAPPAAAAPEPAPRAAATPIIPDSTGPGPQPPPSSIMGVIARDPSIIGVERPTTVPPSRTAPAKAEPATPSAAPEPEETREAPREPQGDPEPAEVEGPSEPAVAPVDPVPQPTPQPPPQPAPASSYAHIININTASAAELDLLPGIGPALADRIIAYRTANGPFRTVDDITQVRGIGPKTLEKLRPRIRVK